SFVDECSPMKDATLRVLDANGVEMIRYGQSPQTRQEPPDAATEPRLPEEMESADELYLTGLHLEQYRHATRQPEAYWEEALRRDSGDARCNNALGLWHLRRAEFAAAERHFIAAINRLTRLNPNPYDGEPFYNLGVTLCFLDRDEEAYDAFFKATWNQAWRGASYHALAELDAKRRNWHAVVEHLELALALNRDNLRARNLLVIALRSKGDRESGEEVLHQTRALDPLDVWARYLTGVPHKLDNQMRLDLSIDYARAGLYRDAKRVLEESDFEAQDGSVPMVYYALGQASRMVRDQAAADEFYGRAAHAPASYCFPHRPEELVLLEAAIQANSWDSRAHFYLGNLLYDRRRYQEAIEHWETAARLDSNLATVWRNLGIGYYNVRGDAAGARDCYEEAFQADPTDARVFYERDQLYKRIGVAAEVRLAEMERHLDLVAARDDLSVELATLYNQTGRAAEAIAILNSRQFQPWEGGEGLAFTQHVRAHLALGRDALCEGEAKRALEFFTAALVSPVDLGEAKHLLANQSNVYFWLGAACSAMGQEEVARSWWLRAANSTGDFQEMSVKRYSEMSYYNAIALKRLGQGQEARSLLHRLQQYASELAEKEPKIDYFATSLPSMLLFEDDLKKRNRITATFLQAQAALGLDNLERASKLLDDVLFSDPNHAWAWDLRQELECDLAIEKRSSITAQEGRCTEA
ncbi:MAG: tetratricopeptide repeat protein, partial [Acidobacteriota bacterium]|nr:tetratricopeptide repeat protein [Acidobacteriota bacterium]